MLPPIVEKHENKLVIIDGMHRLYWAIYHAKVQQIQRVVISSVIDLPAVPIPFQDVVVRLEKPLSQADSFTEFRPELFRQIKLLDLMLTQVS